MNKDKLTAEIIKASKAVRKKQLALKMGRSEEQNLLEKHFKPITEPLEKFLKTTTTTMSIKQEPKVEFSPSSPKQQTPTRLHTPKQLTTAPTTTAAAAAAAVEPANKSLAAELEEIGYDPFTEEENQQIATEKSFQQFREEYQNMLTTQPNIVDEFLDQYDPLPQVYIDGLLRDTEGEYDTTSGPHIDPGTNSLRLGRSVLEIDGKDIVVDGIRYKGTPGLYELIFKSEPLGYNKEDGDRYRDILNRTSVHRRNYDPNQQIKGNKGRKYVHVIKPLTFRQRATTFSGSGSIGEKMTYTKVPYQFVYWDDINELVDRLKLLIASQQAGHTGHTNEIASIIEELREAEVIH